jgi:hypothetical protein
MLFQAERVFALYAKKTQTLGNVRELSATGFSGLVLCHESTLMPVFSRCTIRTAASVLWVFLGLPKVGGKEVVQGRILCPDASSTPESRRDGSFGATVSTSGSLYRNGRR